MINFIGREAQTGHSETDKNITKIQQRTGYGGDNDILKNIYDLEGNNREWTVQAYKTEYRVGRGGYYDSANNGYFYPASYGDYNKYGKVYSPNNAYYIFASRISLYL